MACTEIPLALYADDVQIPLLDPTNLLAQAAVKKALWIK
jgi:aspartate/glutamate racemase